MSAAGCNDGLAAASPLAVRLHRQLSSAGWPDKGLSPANRVICALILVSVTLVMLETEPVLFERAATFFIAAEAVPGGLFLIEYVARVYAAGAERRSAGVRGRLRYMATPVALLDLVAIGLVAVPAGILAAAFSDTFQRQTRDRDAETNVGHGETRATLTAGGGRVGSAPRPSV